MEPFRLSFRTRLAFWYTLLLAVTVLVLGFVIVTVSRVSVLNTVDSVLEGTGHNIFNVIEVSGDADEPIKIRSDSPMRTPGTWVQIWEVMDDDGESTSHLLWASDSLEGVNDALDPGHLITREPSYSSLIFNGQTLRVLTLPLFAGSELCGVLQVATSTTYFAQMQQSLVPIIFIAAVVAIFISLLMSVALAARAVRPIEKVTQAANRIVDARDLSTRLTVEDADEEMGKLIQVFNHMMERLEHVFDVQQRLINDVSHEMRTPLTSILGNIEIMERYGVEPDALQSIHQEAERLARTVNELLLLVRADTGEIAVEMVPLSLDSLLLEVYEQAHILMKDRALKLILEQIDPIRMRGNRDRLHQMIMNLVTNAIKFTPDNGSIRLSLKRVGDQAVLKVADTGIGISPEDQQRIYDRFFQVDPSRLHRQHDGAGLGLSIAKWVVDIHHGQIVVHSVMGQGTSFEVTLPALPPSPTRHDDHEDEWPEISRKRSVR